MTAGGVAVSEEWADSKLTRLEVVVGDHHRRHPFQLGMPAARAASELGIEQGILAELTNHHPHLRLEGTVIRDPQSEVNADPTGLPPG